MVERGRVFVAAIIMALVFAAGVAAQALPAKGKAAEGTKEKGRTSITAELPNGRVLLLSTGTEGGDCTWEGTRLTCVDGGSLAVADLRQGCLSVKEGGRCRIVPGTDTAGDDLASGTIDTPADSGIDIECETGAKAGYIYTISDTDGHAVCGVNRGVGGRIDGGTCTKNGTECAGVDCITGCLSGSSNCQCRIRTIPTRRVAPAP